METIEEIVTKKPTVFIVRELPKLDWTIYEVATKACPYGWRELFNSTKVELKQISDIVEKRNKVDFMRIVPLMPNVFKAFELTPLNKVKIIIYGLDPYQTIREDGLPRAQGLSFSVGRHDVIPPSLRNIYKALQYNYPDYRHPGHGDLTFWANQGVLLLNSCLTTEVDKTGAHGQIWFPFLKCVFEAIKKINPNVIVFLWGRDAQKMQSFINAKDSHTFSWAHPAARAGEFLTCPHFRNANYLLKNDGFSEIDWQL
jgi:uracil-DNA glycosylase